MAVEPPLRPSAPRPVAPVSALTTSDTKDTRSTPRRSGTVMSSRSPSCTTIGAFVPLHTANEASTTADCCRSARRQQTPLPLSTPKVPSPAKPGICGLPVAACHTMGPLQDTWVA